MMDSPSPETHTYFFNLLLSRLTCLSPNPRPLILQFELCKARHEITISQPPIHFQFSPDKLSESFFVEMPFSVSSLNFSRSKYVTLMMRELEGEEEDSEVGRHTFCVNEYAEEHATMGTSSVREVVEMGQYELEVAVIVQDSRISSEKWVRQIKQKALEMAETEEFSSTLSPNRPSDIRSTDMIHSNFSSTSSSPRRRKMTIHIIKTNKEIELQKGHQQSEVKTQAEELVYEVVPKVAVPSWKNLTLQEKVGRIGSGIRDFKLSDLPLSNSRHHRNIRYCLKLIIFAVLSIYLILHSMQPARKCPSKPHVNSRPTKSRSHSRRS